MRYTDYDLYYKAEKEPITISEPRAYIPFKPAYRKYVSEEWKNIQSLFSKVEWTKDRDEADVIIGKIETRVKYTDKLYCVKDLDTKDVWHDLTFGQLLKLTKMRYKSAQRLKPGEEIFYDGFKIKLEV